VFILGLTLFINAVPFAETCCDSTIGTERKKMSNLSRKPPKNQVVNEEPKWTDIAQAWSAMIGAALVFVTLWKLVARDLERENEVKSLMGVAQSLAAMVSANEERERVNKIPHILITHSTTADGLLKITVENSNAQCQLNRVDLMNDEAQQWEYHMMKSIINQSAGKHSCEIQVKLNVFDRNSTFILDLDYITEDGLRYMQSLTFWMESGVIKLAPGTIKFSTKEETN